MKPVNHRLEALDSYRGLAAVAVFFYHFPSNFFLLNWQLVKKSYLFVDFFFILSGFVIALNYLTKINSFFDVKSFMKKRFLRLYPLHFFMLILYLGIEFLKFFSSQNEAFSSNNIWSFFTNLFLVHSLGIHDGLTYNSPSWSISTEFYAYFVFALVAIFMQRISKSFQSLFFLIVAIASYVVVYYIKAPSLDVTYDLGFIRCIAGFFLGAFLSGRYKNLQDSNFKVSPFVMPFTFLAIIVIFSQTILKNIDYLMPPLFASLILSTALSKNGSLLRILAIRPLKWIGERSYSLYMIQALVIWLNVNILKLVFKVPSEQMDGKLILITSPIFGALNIIVVFLILLVASSFTYKYIESRFTNK
jgi:peptidoglycan/LPS O-acetylase OafA/YrhL